MTPWDTFRAACDVIRENDPEHHDEFYRLGFASVGEGGSWLDDHYADAPGGSWLPRFVANIDRDLEAYFAAKRVIH